MLKIKVNIIADDWLNIFIGSISPFLNYRTGS